MSQEPLNSSHLHKKSHKRSDSDKKRKRDVRDGSQSRETLTTKGKKTSSAHESDNQLPADSNLFCTIKSSFYLPLSPISQLHPLPGICAEHLSPLILSYYPPVKGVVLSYKNPKLSERPDGSDSTQGNTKVLAKTIDEFAVSFIWLTVELLVFRPQRGAIIEGWVNLQNESHIGLVCWNVFNASIESKRLPQTWKWVGSDLAARTKKKKKLKNTGDDPLLGLQDHNDLTSTKSNVYEGHFEDGEGNKIEGLLKFRVKDMVVIPSNDKEKAFVSIEGTLLPEDMEADLMVREATTGGNVNGSSFASRHRRRINVTSTT